MGCGCNKGKTQGVVGQARSTIFQALDPKGALVAEFSSVEDARKAATAAGGRVRITSRAG